MRLSIGMGIVGKLFATVVVAFIAAIALTFLSAASPRARAVIVDVVPEEALELLPLDMGPVPSEFRVWFTALPLVILVVCVLGLLRAYRYGVRLNRTVVTVRNTFSTQRVDLARAVRFRFGERTESTTHQQGSFDVHTTYRVPLLYANRARIPLAYYGRTLPSYQLEALARAIEAGGVRPGPYGYEGMQAAQALRSMIR